MSLCPNNKRRYTLLRPLALKLKSQTSLSSVSISSPGHKDSVSRQILEISKIGAKDQQRFRQKRIEQQSSIESQRTQAVHQVPTYLLRRGIQTSLMLARPGSSFSKFWARYRTYLEQSIRILSQIPETSRIFCIIGLVRIGLCFICSQILRAT